MGKFPLPPADIVPEIRDFFDLIVNRSSKFQEQRPEQLGEAGGLPDTVYSPLAENVPGYGPDALPVTVYVQNDVLLKPLQVVWTFCFGALSRSGSEEPRSRRCGVA
jgi:hypothetical protein